MGGEGRKGRGKEQKVRECRERGGRVRLGYLSRGREFLVTPLVVLLYKVTTRVHGVYLMNTEQHELTVKPTEGCGDNMSVTVTYRHWPTATCVPRSSCTVASRLSLVASLKPV